MGDSLRATVVAYVPANPQEAAAIAAGDALFKSNCAQCHAVNEKVVGPALAGITKRRSINWIIPWVHNSAKVIASGDEYAVRLYGDYSKQQMPAFPNLTDQNIKNIVAFVSAQEGSSATDSAPALAVQ
ncbi:c-type cytochrome [Hymenobacter polaris]|nr:cytochrome c [Hymenobacter polaris]